MTKHIYKLIIALALFSCNKVTDNTMAIQIAESPEQCPLEDLVDMKSKKLISSNKEALFSNANKIIRMNSCYHIMDANMGKIIKYDSSGNYLSSFSKIGNAKNEYIYMYDFSCSDDNIYILSYPSKILVTDLDYNIEKIYPLTKPYDRVAYFDNKIYLYLHSEKAIYEYDIESGEEALLLKDDREENTIAIGREPVFHKINKNVMYITMSGSDNIYEISNSKVKKILKIDYEGKSKDYEELKHLDIDDVISLFRYSPPTILSIGAEKDITSIYYTHKGRFRLLNIDSQHNIVGDILISSFPEMWRPINFVDSSMYILISEYNRELDEYYQRIGCADIMH